MKNMGRSELIVEVLKFVLDPDHIESYTFLRLLINNKNDNYK